MDKTGIGDCFEDKIRDYINEFGDNTPQEVLKEIVEQIQARQQKRGASAPSKIFNKPYLSYNEKEKPMTPK